MFLTHTCIHEKAEQKKKTKIAFYETIIIMADDYEVNMHNFVHLRLHHVLLWMPRKAIICTIQE